MNIADELHKRFTYHPPHGDQAQRYEDIRRNGANFAGFLLASCPESRELSLALTNIEQAVMWANAAIARNEAADDKPS